MATANHRQCSACHPAELVNKPDKVVKSKDVLDIRIVPGNPNNAWIECYKNTYDDIDAKTGKAEENAQIESARLKNHLMEKEEKLRAFQSEVQQRVGYLQKLKKQEEQRKALKRIEDEHNLVLQRTLGVHVPYRGTAEDLQVLNKELLKSCIIPCNNDRQLLQNEVDDSDKKVEQLSEEIKQENLRARSRLLLKKLDTYERCLPGGCWKSPQHRETNEPLSELDKNIETVLVTDEPPMVTDGAPWDIWLGNDDIKRSIAAVTEEQRHKELHGSDGRQKNNFKSSEQVQQACGELDDSHRLNNHEQQACSELDDLHRLNNHVDTDNLLHIYRDFGKDKENAKVQKQNQYWKYRKLFMDIERDQVKERKKLNDHRKKIQQLKLQKEKQRKQTESEITQFTEKVLAERNVNACEEVGEVSNGITDLQKKCEEKEMYRYMEALRKVAKERIAVCNVSIPPLCSCGPSFWDSHPDKCANNCIFYKNIRIYVSALTSALANTR